MIIYKIINKKFIKHHFNKSNVKHWVWEREFFFIKLVYKPAKKIDKNYIA
jgi:hypothetical protein